MNNKLSLESFNIEGATPLDFNPAWPDKVHQFSREEALAIMAAQFAQRPLLIEGPPGSGKSQIAAAAAAALNRELLVYVVNSNTQPEDLLWQYDALKRLNDAQAQKIKGDEHYLSKGPLWMAFESQKTDDKNNNKEGSSSSANSYCKPFRPNSPHVSGTVVLLDEIDKADRSVPNSLLDVFGHRRFYCPHLDQMIQFSEGDAPPLVIITSNKEQQLPAAFVRRCLVLRIGLPAEKKAFVSKLSSRALLHFKNKLTEKQYGEIAEIFHEYRERSGLSEEMQPGQAEYFDLVRAIGEALEKGTTEQDGTALSFETLLEDLQGLVLNKAQLLEA